MGTMIDNATLELLRHGYDAILLDVGATLVAEAPAGTPVADLRAHPLPGVIDCLHALAGGLRLAAVTNTATMRADDVRALLTPAGIAAHLEHIVTSSEVGAAKPDPAVIRVVLDRLGVPASRALLVGDAVADREAARAAGVAFRATDRGLADALVRAAAAGRGAFASAAARVRPVDAVAAERTRERSDQLTKPAGSLGELERVAERLAAITGRCPPPIANAPAVAVFAADHGVVASGVTPWPQSITAAMVHNFASGGAAINAIARQVGATVHIVDVGVNADLAHLDRVRGRKIRMGTADLASGPAMTSADAQRALDVGAEIAAELIAAGHDLLITGDMGIGNTTPSAALIAAGTGASAARVTGRGTGIDDATLAHKTDVVAGAVARTAAFLDPLSTLSEIGGLEIAAMAGFIVGAAAERTPVVIDGVVALAALVVADAFSPGIAAHVLAGHRSTEPGATVVLEHLGLEPLIDLRMRLGEGTGACLAVPIVQCAARIVTDMATLDSLDAGS
jgi:nicotinate-nucleotide--dimethylbenzimidazole phosphoribosyltransferase